MKIVDFETLKTYPSGTIYSPVGIGEIEVQALYVKHDNSTISESCVCAPVLDVDCRDLSDRIEKLEIGRSGGSVPLSNEETYREDGAEDRQYFVLEEADVQLLLDTAQKAVAIFKQAAGKQTD